MAGLTLDRIALTAGCGIGHPAIPQAIGDWGLLVDIRTTVNDASAGTNYERDRQIGRQFVRLR